jgi:hypothetical protein
MRQVGHATAEVCAEGKGLEVAPGKEVELKVECERLLKASSSHEQVSRECLVLRTGHHCNPVVESRTCL